MLERIKAFIVKMNKLGIPVPMLRDPLTQLPSVSLTMLFISFNMVFIGLIGKWSKYLDIDIQQAIYWFMVCAGLYFSRKISGSGKGDSKLE